jgi:hypothetical protein
MDANRQTKRVQDKMDQSLLHASPQRGKEGSQRTDGIRRRERRKRAGNQERI